MVRKQPNANWRNFSKDDKKDTTKTQKDAEGGRMSALIVYFIVGKGKKNLEQT